MIFFGTTLKMFGADTTKFHKAILLVTSHCCQGIKWLVHLWEKSQHYPSASDNFWEDIQSIYKVFL